MAIMTELRRRGAEVTYNDPFVPRFAVGETLLESQELTTEELGSADCVLIVTNHPGYDWDWVVRSSQLVVDTRNATKGIPVNGHTLFKL